MIKECTQYDYSKRMPLEKLRGEFRKLHKAVNGVEITELLRPKNSKKLEIIGTGVMKQNICPNSNFHKTSMKDTKGVMKKQQLGNVIMGFNINI